MYLFRLDDATDHWNKENWHRMHDLLEQFNIKPIVAIIPNNEDPKLLKLPTDLDYLSTIKQWINEGWTPALHGFNHILFESDGGINPINLRSEFAGLPLKDQKQKIVTGLHILNQKGIDPVIFVAPAHTFDKNTIEALRTESDIRIISDTVAKDCYKNGEFYFIPQQKGVVKAMHLPLVTFCYHPNYLTDKQFHDLERFLTKHHEEFTYFNNSLLKERHISIADVALRKAYFFMRKLSR